jgi:hypothetical protein
MEGKEEFYKKVEVALRRYGYQYFGQDDIKGIGRSHMSKPDYIAVKGNVFVIGEIKSPKEGPKSTSWRQVQNSDGEKFREVRLDVVRKEEMGLLQKEVGGHEIIIRGQIPDYVEKMGETYVLPPQITGNESMILGYSFPTEETFNVNRAFGNCGQKVLKTINIGNGVTTFFFNEK